MRFGLLLIFAAVPFVELALLIKLGQSIGFWWTLAVIVGTAVLGTYIINRQSLSVMQRAMEAVQNGRAPVASVVEGVILIIAGLLLVTPGLITDVLGSILLIPPARRWIAIKGLRQLLKSHAVRVVIFGNDVRYGTSGRPHTSGDNRRTSRGSASEQSSNDQGTVIEGEYERVSERTVDPKRGRTE